MKLKSSRMSGLLFYFKLFCSLDMLQEFCFEKSWLVAIAEELPRVSAASESQDFFLI